MPQPRSLGRDRTLLRSANMSSLEPFLSYQSTKPYDMSYNQSLCTPSSSDSLSTPRIAYVENFQGPADDGWYLDNSATHHLTNMANMHV